MTKWQHRRKIGLLLFLSAGLMGCDDYSASSKAPETGKIQIVVATSGSPKPFVYVAENNALTGYDIDVVNAIFARLPQYELAFVKAEFPSVLAGLDSDRYHIGANNFAMNEVRKEKYIYSAPIFKNEYVIAVAEKNTEIQAFRDLAGKSTEVTPGLNYATVLENYNQAHPQNPVKINYTEADLPAVLQHVESGKFDFQLIDRAMLQGLIHEHKLALKSIPITEQDEQFTQSPYSYLLFSKGKRSEKLVHDVNMVLQTLGEDGTLKQISIQYFGADFSPQF